MKEKRFEGLKKSDYIIEKDKTFFKRDNVTVCVLDVVIPIDDLIPGTISDSLVNKIHLGFPEVQFNYNECFPAFMVNVRGKAVCTPDDEYNEEVGETVAYSKAQAKAYSIVNRLATIMAQHLATWFAHAQNVSEYFKIAQLREMNFVNNI